MAIGHAYIEIHAITSGFKQEVQDALKDLEPMMKKLGEDGGKSLSKSLNSGFRRGGGFSGLEQQALAARESLNKLIKTGYVLGPVISGLVSAVGDLVFGLGAMVAAVGAAAPALSALGGSFAALIQGALTAKLAFGGIGAAVGAINKPQQGPDNSKAIEDARRRLALVYQRAAETMADANDRVRDAQLELNRAYEEGAESLQQLGFNAEDAALSQDKAAIQLERARESLMRVQDLDPNDRARRDAEIAFREAELNYRKTTDQVNDLREQQEYAARTGVEGTKEVIDAKNNLAEAEAARAKQERDNAQDIAEAQRAVAEALARSASAASAINDAMKDLSPEAQRFAKYIAGLKPVLLDMRAAAGRKLFGPLEDAIQNLVDKLVPVLLPMLEATGEVLGGVATAISKVFTSAQTLDIFKRIFGGTNLIVIENLGQAFANILDLIFKLLDAAAPLTARFAIWVRTLTDTWVASMNAEGAIGRLTEKFNRAGDIAAILGSVLKKTYDGLKAFFGPGVEAGIQLWEAFGGAMDNLKKFSEEGQKSGELQAKFAQIARNVEAIGGALAIVVEGLFEMAGSKGTEVFVEGIKPALRILIEIGKTLTSEGVSKAMSNLIVQVATLIQKFTESGGVENFFNILTEAAVILNKIFDNELVMQVFAFLAGLKGITLAFGVIKSTGMLFGNAFLGNLIVARNGLTKVKDAALMGNLGLQRFRDGLVHSKAGMSAFATPAVQMGGVLRGLATRDMVLARTSMQGLSAAFMAGTGPAILIIAAIAAVVAIFALAYKNSEKLREAVSKMVELLKGAFADAWEDIQKALSDAGIKVEGLQDVFEKIGDFLSVTLIPAMTIFFSYLIRYVGGVIAGIIRIGKGLFDWFGAAIDGFKAFLALLRGDTDGFLKYFRSAWEKLGSALSNILGGLFQPFKSAWDGIAKSWNSMIGGKTIKTPFGEVKIPFLPVFEKVEYTGPKVRASSGSGMGRVNAAALAEGGIVRATPGGITAIIGEAGRNERVEPLDPNGLSERDKAMIRFLSGGGAGGGNTFNVYPSAGMDEVELANVVSRKVAWNMRRGA